MVKKKSCGQTETDDQNIDLHSKMIVSGQPGFDSRRAQSLRPCSFETVQATDMYSTFLETSNQYLFVYQTTLNVAGLYQREKLIRR